VAKSPVQLAFGVGGIGIGVLLLYASYKNVPVLGDKGLLSSVFTTGKLPAAPAAGSGGGAAGGSGDGTSPPSPTPGPDGQPVPLAPGSPIDNQVAPTPATPAPHSPASEFQVSNDNPLYWLPGISV
jgi:hypothetical protein